VKKNNIMNQKTSNHIGNTVLSANEKDEVLKSFMKEFFPFGPMKKCGFFTKEMKGDYKAQSEKVCSYFGYKSIYEYGAKEVRCHLSTGEYYDGVNESGELVEKPFVNIIPSIYNS
jgi:hypothetical protein